MDYDNKNSSEQVSVCQHATVEVSEAMGDRTYDDLWLEFSNYSHCLTSSKCCNFF